MTKEDRNKALKLTGAIVVMAVMIVFALKVKEAISSNTKAFEEDLPSVYALSSQDSNLIAPQYRKELKVEEVRRGKVRNDISVLSIGKDYIVILQELKLLPGSSLTQAVHTRVSSTDRSIMVSYSVLDVGEFSYQYKTGMVESTTELHLTLSGSNIESLKTNDSLVSYSLKAKALSLQYSADSVVDTYLTAKGDGPMSNSKPMNILMLRRNGAVYFIVLTAKEGKELPKPDMIHEIINLTSQ